MIARAEYMLTASASVFINNLCLFPCVIKTYDPHGSLWSVNTRTQTGFHPLKVQHYLVQSDQHVKVIFVLYLKSRNNEFFFPHNNFLKQGNILLEPLYLIHYKSISNALIMA